MEKTLRRVEKADGATISFFLFYFANELRRADPVAINSAFTTISAAHTTIADADTTTIPGVSNHYSETYDHHHEKRDH
ncbi:hypothetical protein [Jeotgalibacillus terrae]|uniref:Uncharacterized protein n=1 Tax=Jeotgalibacillus terrae TaxID=587735 RepID=A0ABW5ZF39_9BACL|nr:hypothetical protein [Jeotgalibacillus terrae]MBM7579075.1 hypothetical protein [Jeotgalibacillus terrae]